MCGICGFNWEDRQLVKDMACQIKHRGPDQEGDYTDSNVSLGHKRLSIIDLSEKGKQPMSNEDGSVWLVYNGEIYNFAEIKEKLEKKGHKFKSHTDSEVIVHAYEEYGIKCVELFNGMFAFAIWDSKNKKIFLARDRLGIKPLYYYFDKKDNKFIFGSEIKAIVKNPVVKREINFKGLNQFIDYSYTINGETIFKGINELLPGYMLAYNSNSLEVNRYWEVRTNVQYKNEEFFVKKLRAILKEAVKKQLVADVPLGASLSGGIDSSAVVAFMSQIADQPVKTFTMGFNDPSDELKYARMVADFCKTEHHEIMVEFKEITEHFPKIVWHAESPFGRPSMFSGYFLSRGINKNKVIIDLSGSGGDEVFAGYNRYEPYLPIAKNEGLTNLEKSKKIVSNYFPDKEKGMFFNEDALKAADSSLLPEKTFLPYLERVDKREQVNAALEFELVTELQGIQLIRDDRMSMAHAHEVRVPLLDHEVVEFGMTIPSSFKWNGNNKKYIFQKAMKGMLPDEIVNRVKIPFGMPLLRYFQEDFIDVAGSIVSNSTFLPKYAKKERIIERIRKIKEKKETNDNALRQVLFLTALEVSGKLFFEKKQLSEKDFAISNFL